MEFFSAFKKAYLTDLFNYSGSSSRTEFFKALGFLIFTLTPLLTMLLIAFTYLLVAGQEPFTFVGVGFVAGVLYAIPLLGTLSLISRRWHDAGISFKWYILLACIDVLAHLYIILADEFPIWLMVLSSISLITVIAVSCIPSQSKENRFRNNTL